MLCGSDNNDLKAIPKVSVQAKGSEQFTISKGTPPAIQRARRITLLIRVGSLRRIMTRGAHRGATS
jgi:hypothetical protein